MNIRGLPVGTTMPRTNYEQTDPTKADYLKGKDKLDLRISNAQTTADGAVTAAGDAQETANNAATAAQEAKDSALPKAGGTMTGAINMGSNAIENVPYPTENAHPATKGYVDNHKIDRAHLADDALYSPVKASSTETQYYFVESDLGKTIMPSSGADSSDITYILSDTLANALPYGAEIAVCFRFGKSLKIKLEGEIYSAMVGDSGMQKAKTYQIQERYGMVALKKINYTDTYTSWLVTGNVEVV